jgi:hypothetical protein
LILLYLRADIRIYRELAAVALWNILEDFGDLDDILRVLTIPDENHRTRYRAELRWFT